MNNLLQFVGDVECAITDSEFSLFQELVLRESGIRLTPSKRVLLVGRLWRRVRQLGLDTFHDYYRRVRLDAAERQAMIDLVATNETAFFREPKQFALLETSIVPAWKRAADAGARPRRLRVWSAGCSTGEEPYSVAMVLDSMCEGWEIEIVASDISTRALRTAAAGIWPREKANNIPNHYLKRYMLEGFRAQVNRVKVADSIRQHVRFVRANLNDKNDYVGGSFDLVLCRNVLIYFDGHGRAAALGRLIDACNRGGYLFLGHAETLGELRAGVRAIEPAVWVRT
jgi:chemotaxis protein methyltransferase CheR